MFQPGHVPANKHRVSTVNPVKDLDQIQAIKELLKDKPRDLLLWTLGINVALRASDLLNILRSDILFQANDTAVIEVLEKKTGKRRTVIVNPSTGQLLKKYLYMTEGTYLFEGQRGKLTTRYLGALVKSWAKAVGVEERCAGHTLRKTHCRVQIEHFGTSLHTMMHVLRHDSERTTLIYAGITPDDVKRASMNTI